MDSICKPPEADFYAPEPVRLAEALSYELHEMETLSTRFSEARRSLDEFLADYLTRVGPLISRLSKLVDPSREDASEMAALPLPESSVPAEGAAFQKELKRLYRDLAKACHPDQQGGRADYMQIVNHAYQHRNLASLWSLSLHLLPTRRPDDLHQRLEALRASRRLLSSRLDALEQSPEYLLMQRVFFERLQGRDLVRAIERDLIQRVQQEERRTLFSQMCTLATAR
jgi:hypothetical protein